MSVLERPQFSLCVNALDEGSTVRKVRLEDTDSGDVLQLGVDQLRATHAALRSEIRSLQDAAALIAARAAEEASTSASDDRYSSWVRAEILM